MTHEIGVSPERSSEKTAQRLRSLQPTSVEELDRMRDAVWSATDPVMLELARLRIADLLGDWESRSRRTPVAVAAGLDETVVDALANWHASPLFGAAERAHLAVAEQFATSVAHISDEEIEMLLKHLSEDEAYAFVVALYVVEVDMRLHMTARAVLLPEGGHNGQ